MSGDDKLKENIMRLFHVDRSMVYCETQEEVDEFMDLAEYVGAIWVSGKAPRDSKYATKSPIVFGNNRGGIHCFYPPYEGDVEKSIPISAFHNYVIAVRNRR